MNIVKSFYTTSIHTGIILPTTHCNYRTYTISPCFRSPAGRQLLVDFHYLCQWITSEKLGLLPSTVQDLSSLPVTLEIEQGLQILVCGGTTITEGLTNCRDIVCSNSDVLYVRGLSSLPVWSEIAWYSSTDWQKCISN